MIAHIILLFTVFLICLSSSHGGNYTKRYVFEGRQFVSFTKDSLSRISKKLTPMAVKMGSATASPMLRATQPIRKDKAYS
jgi:hypothetical protein